VRPARTPPSTFLFLPIQLSNSKSNFKRCSPVKQYKLRDPATGFYPDTETLSPRSVQPGGFEARETREKRSTPTAQSSVQSVRAYRSSPLPLSTGVFKKLQKPPPWLSVPCESTRFPGSLLACSAICPTNQTLARNVLRDGLRPHNRVPKSRLPFALPECLTSLTSSNFSRFQNYVGRVSAGGKFAHRPHQSRLTSGPAGGLLCLDPVVTPH
jgi:hypothetical protein